MVRLAIELLAPAASAVDDIDLSEAITEHFRNAANMEAIDIFVTSEVLTIRRLVDEDLVPLMPIKDNEATASKVWRKLRRKGDLIRG